jgi:hypothetical protein
LFVCLFVCLFVLFVRLLRLFRFVLSLFLFRFVRSVKLLFQTKRNRRARRA